MKGRNNVGLWRLREMDSNEGKKLYLQTGTKTLRGKRR